MTEMNSARHRLMSGDLIFGVTTCISLLVAHAVAYMTHEYSHSFVAWALGWMHNPLALDYGRPTLGNIVLLGEVGDNVQYDPIFSNGCGIAASAIALSGAAIGNGLLYFALYFASKLEAIMSSRVRLAAIYWLCVMCVGNVWSYVPIRALANHADIAIAARGFGVPTWVQFPFLIVPALFIVGHFLVRMVPQCARPISNGQAARSTLVLGITAYWLFALFGGVGMDGDYGGAAQLMALTSTFLIFPLAFLWLVRRNAA